MSSIKYKSGEQDGASAIGHEIDVTTTLSTAGAKLLSLKNAGIEKLAIDKDGNIITAGANSIWTVRPHEGGAGIQAAITAALTAGGGIVKLLAGTYTITTSISISPTAPLILEGVGDATILDDQVSASPYVFTISGPCTAQYAFDDFSAGATSVYTTTHAQAANILQGDYVYLTGVGETGLRMIEWAIAAANGNGTTGEVQLDRPTARGLTTSVTGWGFRAKPLTLRNFKIVDNSAAATNAVFYAYYLVNAVFQNITVDGKDTDHHGIYIAYGINELIDQITLNNIGRNGLNCIGLVDSKITNCYLNRVGCVNSNSFAITTDTHTRLLVEKNTLLNSGGYGIAAGGNGESLSIVNNKIYRSYYSALRNYTSNALVSGNYIYNAVTSGTGYPIEYLYVERFIIKDNIILNSKGGYGIIAYGLIGGGVGDGYGHNNIVSGNIIRNQTGGGLYVLGMYCVCVNNVLDTLTSLGIQVNYMYVGTICKNIINGSTGTGIMVDASQDLVISDNSIKNPGTYGMTLSGSSNKIAVTNNVLDGNGTAAYVITCAANSAVDIQNNIGINFTGSGGYASIVHDGSDGIITGNNMEWPIRTSGTGMIVGLNKAG